LGKGLGKPYCPIGLERGRNIFCRLGVRSSILCATVLGSSRAGIPHGRLSFTRKLVVGKVSSVDVLLKGRLMDSSRPVVLSLSPLFLPLPPRARASIPDTIHTPLNQQLVLVNFWETTCCREEEPQLLLLLHTHLFIHGTFLPLRHKKATPRASSHLVAPNTGPQTCSPIHPLRVSMLH
jgi:hypothetical protein